MNLHDLAALERLVTKTQRPQVGSLGGETLIVGPIVKSRCRRYTYKLGQRHMARDQIEREISGEK